jgi:hypothetical protein
VDHVSGAEQNSALMSECWSKMDSDDNRNVISDHKHEWSEVFKDERIEISRCGPGLPSPPVAAPLQNRVNPHLTQ